jgi:hypothetical protein
MAANVLSYPLTVDPGTGSFLKVTQNTDTYKGQQIQTFLRTHLGERPVFPQFGADDPIFGEFSAESFAEKFSAFYPSTRIKLEEIELVESGGALTEINVSFE